MDILRNVRGMFYMQHSKDENDDGMEAEANLLENDVAPETDVTDDIGGEQVCDKEKEAALNKGAGSKDSVDDSKGSKEEASPVVAGEKVSSDAQELVSDKGKGLNTDEDRWADNHELREEKGDLKLCGSLTARLFKQARRQITDKLIWSNSEQNPKTTSMRRKNSMRHRILRLRTLPEHQHQLKAKHPNHFARHLKITREISLLKGSCRERSRLGLPAASAGRAALWTTVPSAALQQ